MFDLPNDDDGISEFFKFMLGMSGGAGPRGSSDTLFEDCSECPAFEDCDLPARAEWIKRNQPKPVTASQVQGIVRKELKSAFAQAMFVTPAMLQTALAESEKRILEALNDRLPSVRFGRWIMSFVTAPRYFVRTYRLAPEMWTVVMQSVFNVLESPAHATALLFLEHAATKVSKDMFEKEFRSLLDDLDPEKVEKKFTTETLRGLPRGSKLGYRLGVLFQITIPYWFSNQGDSISFGWHEYVVWPFEDHIASRVRYFFVDALPAKRKDLVDRFYAWILPIKPIDHL